LETKKGQYGKGQTLAVNYPSDFQLILNHAPYSDITHFSAIKKSAFSSEFATVTRI
jgi:hypothetical protein